MPSSNQPPDTLGYCKRAEQQALLQNQFRLPRGLLGRIVGWWMSRDNERMNRRAVELLDAGPADDVLEIGFGPGQAIEFLAQGTQARLIAGVDPSHVMVEQASERNRSFIAAGRVVLLAGAAGNLPFVGGRFSKVLVVANLQIWDSPAAGLAEVRRVLRPEGVLVAGLRRTPKRPGLFKSPGLKPDEIAALQTLIESQGFHNVRLVQRRRSRIVCLIASRK